MTRHLRSALAFAACLGILAACGNRDPYKRDDVWYPTGANAANLAAQVVNPDDLIRGRSDPKQLAAGPAKSVSRVLTDTPKSLTPGSSSGSGGGSGAGGGGGGGTPGGDTPTIPAIPSFSGMGGG